MIALDFAPAMVSIITQFFLPMQNPRMDCSAALLSIGTSPSSRNTFRYFSSYRFALGLYRYSLSTVYEISQTQSALNSYVKQLQDLLGGERRYSKTLKPSNISAFLFAYSATLNVTPRNKSNAISIKQLRQTITRFVGRRLSSVKCFR